jgi:hypothetical protein
MARPERRICGVTLKCGGRMVTICDASAIPHVVGPGQALGCWWCS